jgi:hypothetical protein
MKRTFILPVISGLAIIALSATTVVNSAGTYGWTGSPVDGGAGTGGQCSACHSGGASTPTLAWNTSPALSSGNTYTPNQTYTVTITPSGSYPRYGVNCEIINSQSTSTGSVTMFGTFGSALSANTQIIPLSSTTPYPPCVSHTNSSTTAAFIFTWTAPASGTGYIYADVLGANGDGTNGGDKVSGVTTITLTPVSVGVASHSENVSGLNIYPNPATDNVNITYALNERSRVLVKLYSINGGEVAELLNQDQDRGNQSFNSRLPMGLAKGMYFIKLTVNGKHILQKLMIH